jgi:hypothetical protein
MAIWDDPLVNYEELRARLLTLPEATPDWLAYTLAYPADGRPIPVSYCLIQRPDGYRIYKGDGRGGVFLATGDDGETPLIFPSEGAACDWIWIEINWWLNFEARRRGQ